MLSMHEAAPRSGTKSQSTRGSSGPLEHAAADEGHEAGSEGQQNVPTTIPLHSINGQFRGTFHLHEYLGTSSSSSPYTRLQACVTQDGSSTRITPREAEMRAGKGSRKSWKLTLMTTHAGQLMTLQKYFMLMGLEKPRAAESQQTSDHMEEPSEQMTKRNSWVPGGGEGHEEPHSKRQHSGAHEMSRRRTDESGTGALRLDGRRESQPTLSLGSHRDTGFAEFRAFSSHAELPAISKLSEQRYTLLHANQVPTSTFAGRATSAGAIELGSSFLTSTAMASTLNRESADMETLLRSYELSKRLSTATAQALSLPANNNFQLQLSSHDLDKWSAPQTAMLVQNSRLIPVQTMVRPTCHSAVPSLNGWLPISACVLPQGFGPGSLPQGFSTGSLPQGFSSGSLPQSFKSGILPQGFSTGTLPQGFNNGSLPQGFSTGGLSFPLQESTRRLQISAEAASQYGNRFQLSRPPPANSPHRQSETNSAPTLSDFNHTHRASLTNSVPRTSYTDPILPEGLAPSMPGLRQAVPFGQPSLDRLDLSKVPVSIPIFTPNQEVRGTLHLHDYIAGTLSRPNRPPPCVVLECSEDAGGSAQARVTPRAAEAKAGREARKNWKETFRTMHEGRVISLKAFFAMHNIN